MVCLRKYQLANCYQRVADGYTLVSRIYDRPEFMWLDETGEYGGVDIEDPVEETYMSSGRPSRLWIGYPAGEYTIKFIFYEKAKNHGPFTIRVDGEDLINDLVIPADTRIEKTISFKTEKDRIELLFKPDDSKDFIINGIVVYAPEAVEPVPVFAQAPVRFQNEVSALDNQETFTPREMLESIADWLFARSDADGFLGDNYSTPGGAVRMWYTCTFAIRALLAAYEIIGKPAYLDACIRCMDLFVSEQLPNGAFMDSIGKKLLRDCTPEEVLHLQKTRRKPMSDIGSTVGALALTAVHCSAERRERYITALKRFCSDWASLCQAQDGSFCDGYGLGEGVYSCATAIEAATHALVYKVTGDKAYIQTAERAIRYLLPDWKASGRVFGRAPHWTVRSHRPFLLEKRYFGDQWYYDEGMLTVYFHTEDENLKQDIKAAVSAHVNGAEGLLSLFKTQQQLWWPIQDIWNNAKGIGLVQTLMFDERFLQGNDGLSARIWTMIRLICTPSLGRVLGIMLEDEDPGVHIDVSQRWSGMNREATGFAGMTLAEYLKPGILYYFSGKSGLL